MKDFKLIENFIGYRNKTDITKQDARALVSGSQNVEIVDGDRVRVRGGMTLYGASNDSLTPIESSFDWDTSTGTEMRLRSYDDELEFLYSGTWYRLANSFTSVAFNYTTVWDNTEKLDLLLFVNGDSNIRMWSGGVATFASATSNTITKQGSTSWGEERFLVGGTTQITGPDGTVYTYTGGEDTTTLTGVTPDPTAGGYSAGDVFYQTVRTTANTPASGVDNDIIGVLNNQVYVADTQHRNVYVSANDDYTDYTSSSPRLPGEGALLTLDGTPNGFAPQEDAMYISTGTSDWFQTVFTLSSDLANESLTVSKLKSGPQQAAKSQALIGNIKNSVVYVSNEPTFDTLGRVESIDTPQSLPLSDPIKADFDMYDFTGGHVLYFKNKTYISVPAEGLVLVYDHERRYWNPPATMSISRFSIIGDELYGHSSVVPETYKIFVDGEYSDVGNPIKAVAAFAYRKYGKPDRRKNFDEYYTEGYISSNTSLDLEIYYDYGGYESIVTKTILGTSSALLFAPATDDSLGKNSLGKSPLGSTVTSVSDLPKFRVIHELAKVDFYEMQAIYTSNQEDGQWELLAHGANAVLSSHDSTEIKM